MTAVLTRLALVLAASSVLAGCSGQVLPLSGSTDISALAIAPQPVGVAAPSEQNSAQQPHIKSMADRVLAAIALERVTGMKPDPARFIQ